MKPVVFGIAAETLNDEERALFRESDPAGYILFARNVVDRDQLRALTDELRDISGRQNVPILIDQEGGRVTRMKPPVWPEFPPWAKFDTLYDKAPISAIEAARSNAHAIGLTLTECGITVDCLPLLDVRQPGAHDVIGDRALGYEPMRVAALGRAVLDGLGDAGVVGVAKHIPGHGRAMVDTHKALPRVTATADELASDIAPFKSLASAPMAMVWAQLISTTKTTRMSKATATAATRPPTTPSIVFPGETAGYSLWRPNARPAKYAPVSASHVQPIAISARPSPCTPRSGRKSVC